MEFSSDCEIQNVNDGQFDEEDRAKFIQSDSDEAVIKSIPAARESYLSQDNSEDIRGVVRSNSKEKECWAPSEGSEFDAVEEKSRAILAGSGSDITAEVSGAVLAGSGSDISSEETGAVLTGGGSDIRAEETGATSMGCESYPS